MGSQELVVPTAETDLTTLDNALPSNSYLRAFIPPHVTQLSILQGLLYQRLEDEGQKGEAFRHAMRITGTVSSGLGRAHIFMAQKHYQDQFQNLLGTSVWPGTLNLNVSDNDLRSYIALRLKSGIDTLDASSELIEQASSIDISSLDAHRVRGFLRDGVSFGGATAFKAEFTFGESSVECAVLIPDLTRHYDVVEIISPKFLREHFSLVDGDNVTIVLS